MASFLNEAGCPPAGPNEIAPLPMTGRNWSRKEPERIGPATTKGPAPAGQGERGAIGALALALKNWPRLCERLFVASWRASLRTVFGTRWTQSQSRAIFTPPSERAFILAAARERRL